MEGLMQPDRVRTRILLWAEEETRLNLLPPKAGAVVEAVLYRGELPRGEVAGMLGITSRHARRIISELLKRDVLASKGPREPLLLSFPAALASRWMPGLFPKKRQAMTDAPNGRPSVESRKHALETLATLVEPVGWRRALKHAI